MDGAGIGEESTDFRVANPFRIWDPIFKNLRKNPKFSVSFS